MDKFTLTIDLGNDAMCSTGDIAEALRNVADRLELYAEDSGIIRDENGNKVGTWAREGE